MSSFVELDRVILGIRIPFQESNVGMVNKPESGASQALT